MDVHGFWVWENKMPRKRLIKVKSETGSGAKLPGKNRFKNQETKRRQKAKWAQVKEVAQKERSQPSSAHGGVWVWASAFFL